MKILGKTAAVRLRRGAVATLLGVLGLLLVGVPAQAAGRSGAPVPGAADAASQAGLSGVSCSSANACMAVGTRLAGSPVLEGYSLAERWNGKTWTIKPTPNPKGATDSNLYAVSCSAASSCMAVGLYEDAAAPTGVPFAEVWNGTAWTVGTTPNPKGGTNSGLYGVSCSSARACVAVGNTIMNSHNNLFSELWNGRTWTIKTTPRPRGTTYSLLGAVSCRSARFCTAVGDYQVDNSSRSRTLAEAWNGKTWTIKATPNPKDGVNGDGFSGVACSSPDACMAVGGYNNSSNSRNLTLAEAWNGKTWTIKASPNPKGATGSNLFGVSCDASACMAIGDSGENKTLSEAWNGKTWTIKASPNPKGATFSFLKGVSCGAKRACVAVGYEFNSSQAERPVAEVWNGETWTIKAVP
jgi:hypothetical protein